MTKYIKTIDSDGMGTWAFENGVVVREVEFDNDLHEFEITLGDKRATVTPSDIGDMEACIEALDEGCAPVGYFGWEDGLGNDVESLLGA